MNWWIAFINQQFFQSKLIMNLLLDTHILIWALENNPLLSQASRDAIIDGQNLVFVSTASIWEMSIKKNIGKLNTPDNLYEEIKLHRFNILNIEFEHAEIAGSLPLIHKDPFDRMLVAQAISEKLTIVSQDSFIAQYNVSLIQ